MKLIVLNRLSRTLFRILNKNVSESTFELNEIVKVNAITLSYRIYMQILDRELVGGS